VQPVPQGTPQIPGRRVVNLHFTTLAVDVAKAKAEKDGFAIWVLNVGPPSTGSSYIEIGATVGGQGQALEVMAVGDALKLWSVYTPADAGLEGAAADAAAGAGGVVVGPPRDQVARHAPGWAPAATSGRSSNGNGLHL
jgi:hypothetical protein